MGCCFIFPLLALAMPSLKNRHSSLCLPWELSLKSQGQQLLPATPCWQVVQDHLHRVAVLPNPVTNQVSWQALHPHSAPFGPLSYTEVYPYSLLQLGTDREGQMVSHFFPDHKNPVQLTLGGRPL